MESDISKRRDRLNTIILMTVVLIAIEVTKQLPHLLQTAPGVIVALATSKGIYELLITSMTAAINNSNVFLRAFWGTLYIKGFWSYEYTLDGKLYRGVWEIQQDINGIKVVGNGLDDDFRLRTIVRSVSPLIEEAGGYFVINSRNEMAQGNQKVFSKTTLLISKPKHFWQRSLAMRAITEVYGGTSDKQVHPNVIFRLHTNVDSIEELIDEMKSAQQLTPSPT